MDVFVFVLGIILITTAGGLLREKMKQDAKRAAQMPTDYQARFEKIEERLATLERLATDDRQQLKREIDSLHSN